MGFGSSISHAVKKVAKKAKKVVKKAAKVAKKATKETVKVAAPVAGLAINYTSFGLASEYTNKLGEGSSFGEAVNKISSGYSAVAVPVETALAGGAVAGYAGGLFGPKAPVAAPAGIAPAAYASPDSSGMMNAEEPATIGGYSMQTIMLGAVALVLIGYLVVKRR